MKVGFLIRPFFLITCLILLVYSSNFAQDSSNPFELQHRIPKDQITTETPTTPTNENPFDIESRQAPETVSETPVSTPIPEKSNPFDIQRAKPQGNQSIQEAIQPKVEKPIKRVIKEKETKGGFIFYLFLYMLFFLSAGIFVFQVATYYKSISYEFINLVYCTLGIILFFLSKHFILKFLELIFPISKEIKQYSFTIIIFSIILGILLIPFNVFIAFAQNSMTYSGIIAAFIVVIAVYLFRSLRGLFIGSKFLSFHKFHFFMYLCAVEIAPLLILVKLLLNGVNIH